MVSSVLVTANGKGIIISVSAKCADLFGYTPKELIGRNLTVLMPRPYSDMHDKFIERFHRTGEARIIGSSRIVEGLHKDGTILSLRLAVSHVPVEDDHLFVGLIEKVEDASAKMSVDTNGIIVSVNNKCVEMFGFPAREMVGKNVSIIIPEPWRSKHDSYIQRYLSTGHSTVLNRLRNLTAQKKDGHTIPITLKTSVVRHQDGSALFHAEIQDMAQDGYTCAFTCDAQGTISSVSTSFLIFFGFKNADEIVGRHYRTIFPEAPTNLSIDGRTRASALHVDGSRIDVNVEVNRFSAAGTVMWAYQVERNLQKAKFVDPRQGPATPGAARANGGGDDKKKPLQMLEGLGQYVGTYRVGKVLGSGSFGAVLLATHRLTGKVVAIKAIARDAINSNINRELDVLKRVRHPNIVALYEIIETPERVLVVMEYMPGGELFDYVVHNGACDEAEARNYFRDLMRAVDYLHSHGIVHRDLKLENMLLDNNGTVKLIDFGLSNFMAPGLRLETCCGSPMYASPEMYRATPYEGPEVDIWSMGVILYAMLDGNYPFQQPEDVIKGRLRIPDRFSPSCRELISRMLCVDARHRISLDGIFAHPWVEKYGEPLERATSRSNTPTLELEPEIVTMMVDAGFAKDLISASIQQRLFNQVTATYTFLEEKLHLTIAKRRAKEAKEAAAQRKAAAASATTSGAQPDKGPVAGGCPMAHMAAAGATCPVTGLSAADANNAAARGGCLMAAAADYKCPTCGAVDQSKAAADSRIMSLLEALLPEVAKAYNSSKRGGDAAGAAAPASRAEFEERMVGIIQLAKKMMPEMARGGCSGR